LLSENLPQSSNDQIIIKLIEPLINPSTSSHQKKFNNNNGLNCKLNEKNNLEFSLNLGSLKSETLNIKFTIEHPAEKEIDF
jgi:hypothetical protein